IADTRPRLAQLTAELIDLGEQAHDRLAQLGRELGLVDPGDGQRVDLGGGFDRARRVDGASRRDLAGIGRTADRLGVVDVHGGADGPRLLTGSSMPEIATLASRTTSQKCKTAPVIQPFGSLMASVAALRRQAGDSASGAPPASLGSLPAIGA